jgi:hypothetical protein
LWASSTLRTSDAVELTQYARLDLRCARDEVVAGSDSGPAEREEQRERRDHGCGRRAVQKHS